jgi:hypothetical protein
MTNIFNYKPFISKEFANIRLFNQIFKGVFKNYENISKSLDKHPKCEYCALFQGLQ